MKTNLIIKYRIGKYYYVDGTCHFKRITVTKKVTDIMFFDSCFTAKNRQSHFTSCYDSIEQISDGKTLIKFNNNEYKYYTFLVRDLLKTLCNYSTEEGDK